MGAVEDKVMTKWRFDPEDPTARPDTGFDALKDESGNEVIWVNVYEAMEMSPRTARLVEAAPVLLEVLKAARGHITDVDVARTVDEVIEGIGE